MSEKFKFYRLIVFKTRFRKYHIVHEKRADFRQSAFRHTVTVYTNIDKAKILSDVDKRPCDQTKEEKTDISFKVTNVHNENIYGNHPSMLNRSRQVHTAEMNKKIRYIFQNV